jgi:hypothetical protein
MRLLSQEIFDRISQNPNESFFMSNVFKYEDIVSWDDIENYLNNPYIHDNDIEIIDKCGIKFNLNKINFPYCQNPKIIPSQVFDLINKNYSFVLLNMNRFNKKMSYLADEIENNILGNNNLDFHLYCGLGSNSNSFKAHSDKSYNIIMQVDGTSRWKIYSDVFEDTAIFSNEIEKNLNVILDEVMNPGDILYIPAGVIHLCIPKGRRISISSCWYNVGSFVEITLKSFQGERIWHTLNR